MQYRIIWKRIRKIRFPFLTILFMFTLCFLGLREAHAQRDEAEAKVEKSPFVLGETIRFHSSVLGEERLIHVYLPAGYHPDSSQTYPVLYLLDGSAEEDFIHVSGLVQFLSFPWIGVMPPSLVVGIANVDRRRDYSFPTRVEADKKAYPSTGGSAAFIQFLKEELIPLVEDKYATQPHRTLIGQSFGGLLASEILLGHPSLFSRYFIISPSLWWDKESLLDRPLQTKGAGSPEVYIAVGKEGKEMVQPARRLAKKLKGPYKVSFEYYRKWDHGNILHQALYDAFIESGSKKKH